MGAIFAISLLLFVGPAPGASSRAAPADVGTVAAPHAPVPSPLVRPSLTVSIFVSPDPATYEEQTLFEAEVSGGVSPYSFDWLEGPPGCSGEDTQSFYCYPGGEGSFEVEVSVTDSDSDQAYGNLILDVQAVDEVAEISASRTHGPSPLPVSFDAEVEPCCADIQTWLWNFGDGSRGSGYADPTHWFNSTGTFQVQAVLGLEGGATARGSLNITVGPYVPGPRITSFTVTPSSVTLGQNVTFDLQFSGGYNWTTIYYEGLPDGCPSISTPYDYYYTTNTTSFTCRPETSLGYLVVAEVYDAAERNATAEVVLNVVAPGGGGAGTNSASYSGLDLGLTGAVVALAVVSGVLAMALFRRGRTPPPMRAAPASMAAAWGPAPRTFEGAPSTPSEMAGPGGA